jgi:hypothetical protein
MWSHRKSGPPMLTNKSTRVDRSTGDELHLRTAKILGERPVQKSDGLLHLRRWSPSTPHLTTLPNRGHVHPGDGKLLLHQILVTDLPRTDHHTGLSRNRRCRNKMIPLHTSGRIANCGLQPSVGPILIIPVQAHYCTKQYQVDIGYERRYYFLHDWLDNYCSP